ncbi:MAG TPA: hypothetical protein VK619_04885 [Pyrinomonadaceae bacterium]|nr:hypothetical protein [Pyrinomonadaceae bacterium]
MRKVLIALLIAGACLFAIGVKVFSVERGEANTVEPVGEEQEQQESYYEPSPVDNGGFEVEVLVRGVPLEEYRARGRTYIEAREGQEYELRIHNPLGVRVAVALAVDGMNTIDARHTAAYNASKWVIGPYQTITISGWQMSSSRARRFYFTTETDSYGARIGQTENLGVISAVFFRERERRPIYVTPQQDSSRGQNDEREQNQPAPRSSANSSASGATARAESARPSAEPNDDYAATGIGRSVNNDVHWVNLDLNPRPIAELNMRYEFHDALVRLGVLPRPRPYPDPIQRRERATGFDGHRYSPEP